MSKQHLDSNIGSNYDIAFGDTVCIDIPLLENETSYLPSITAATFLLKTSLSDADSSALLEYNFGSGVTIDESTVTVCVETINLNTPVESTTYYWALKISESGIITTVSAGTLLLVLTSLSEPSAVIPSPVLWPDGVSFLYL